MQLFSGDTPLFLAPMAGVTDYAFRTVCAQHGADVTVTEMVSSRALVYQDRKSRGLLRRNEGSLCGAQIFGNDPAMMAEAAQIAVGISRCDFLDINMAAPCRRSPTTATAAPSCATSRWPGASSAPWRTPFPSP